jgi:hypothetical protein
MDPVGPGLCDRTNWVFLIGMLAAMISWQLMHVRPDHKRRPWQRLHTNLQRD